jgi:transposase InsO family protein
VNPTGKHVVDQEYAGHGIEHRLIKPRRPQTNGMVERFNGRIRKVSLLKVLKKWRKTHHGLI